MTRDRSGLFFHYLRLFFNITLTEFCTLIVLSRARLNGIKLGSVNKFNGLAYFYRRINSKISTGSRCTFNSRASSNLIGINRKCMISTLSESAIIKIGNNCGFSGTVIGCFTHVEIGNRVRCGANTLITDSDWHLDDPRSGTPAPVIIENNVWIGEGAKILKGVTIGENSIIGAGSIVVKSIPKNVIAAGNPCKVIRKIH